MTVCTASSQLTASGEKKSSEEVVETMNFVYMSISIHFVWLIWLSLQFYDHDITIAKIVGLVLPHDDITEADSDVLEDNTVRLQPRSESTITTSTHKHLPKIKTYISDFNSEISTRKKNQVYPTNPKKEINDRVPLSLPFFLSENDKVAVPGEQLKSESHPNRKTIQVQTSDDINTKCFLMSFDNSTFVQSFQHDDIPQSSKSFDLQLKVKTDIYPEETHWTLSPLNKQEHKLIDSLGDDESKIALVTNTMHILKYSCFVSSSEEEVDNACFDFSIFDIYEDGMCCWGGVGYYSLNMEKKELISERLYAYDRKTSFCLTDSDITDDDEEDPSNGKLYPSKECLNKNCICDSSPELLSNYNDIESKYPGLHELKTRTMMNILILSGNENLPDVTSPQYMAACWVLNDDPYLIQYSNATAIKTSDAEKRMMQRYILAVHYFSTKPGNWNQDFSFLSHKSECEWNVQYPDRVRGISCDENKNVISFLFQYQNLEGTIIQEISGLKLLESLIYILNEKLHGTIPSSLGQLSQLQYLMLSDSFLRGTIPQELFCATKMKALYLRKTMVTGTIPDSVGNLQALQILDLHENLLTGSIPDTVYSLTDLRRILLNGNMLSSTISPSMGNLEKLGKLRLYDNNLSGSLPSDLGKLKSLFELNLSRNKFSGAVPLTLKSLTNLENLNLFENDLSGEMPSELCEVESLTRMTADCRNDIFLPALSCSCCSYCSDKSPVWNGTCPDSKLKFVIDHVADGEYFNSELLEWDITDTATGREVMGDGPYFSGLSRKSHYGTCVALSDCFSFNLGMSKALKDERSHVIWHLNFDFFHTNYSIYWNEKLVLEDTFKMDIYNATTQPEITFRYDSFTDEVLVGSSCSEKEITCGDKSVPLNSHQRVMYNTAMRVSGTTAFDDIYSPHSRALCWIVENDSWLKDTDISDLEALFIQRYVVTLLHLTSVAGLFGDDELPPSSHECSWKGITCTDGMNTMISLSLSSANQIIGGTLIEEIGNLAFLEILNLSQTELEGTIPHVFSNLYSLKELDLSGNALTGTLPTGFFNQLERLELLDLSDNGMTGMIPTRIGSHSNIEVLRLNNNRFTGELPLDGFASFNLKHLDVSENKLSGSISPTLLKHINIEYLNLGENFFVGSLIENVFDNLTNLKYFNVSKNELTGIIPSFHYNASNITHFDMHANRFTGTLPISITEVVTLEFLNLQGNEITGSIPVEFNNLESLHTLALSHNQLKGSIPISFDKLSNLSNLYLHANELSAKAPIAHTKMDDYITDCGYPSLLLDPIDCPSCSVCCNSEDLCAKQRKTLIGPVVIAVVFILSLLLLMTFIYAVKQRIMNVETISKRFEQSVTHWQASETIGDKSVYHFFLTPSVEGWFIGLFCAIAQLATLFLFINSADITNEGSDLKYTMTCPKNSLECNDKNTLSVFGYFIFALILFGWLTKDIIASIKLFMLAIWKKNIDFFFASMILFLVTSLSIWTSAYYNIAISTKDTDLIIYSVILLFVNELDERLFLLVQTCNLSFADAVEESIRRTSYHEGQKLNVTRGLNKVRKRFLGSSIVGRSSEINEESFAVSNSERKKDPISEDPTNLDLEEETDKRDVVPLHSNSITGSC